MAQSLVELLMAVERVESGCAGTALVEGTCEGDVRDAIVHVSKRISIMRGMPNRNRPLSWTMRDEWAVDVIVKALGKLAARAG